jgi:putative transcriptional regulator
MVTQMKIARIKKNITLKELAEVTGIASGYLSELERGKKNNPSSKYLKIIASALNLNNSNLLDEEDEYGTNDEDKELTEGIRDESLACITASQDD